MKTVSKRIMALLVSLAVIAGTQILIWSPGIAAEAYPTADGDASTIFEGATVRLHNAEGQTPAPSVWKEMSDKTLVQDSLSYFNVLYYELPAVLGTSYEIAGTIRISQVGDLYARLDLIFGSLAVDTLDRAKMATLSPRGDGGASANLNYTNGFRSAGHNWTPETNPEERDWTLPGVDVRTPFAVRVIDRQVTVTLGGTVYAAYTLAAGYSVDDIAFGFHAGNIKVTLSDLYFGPVRQAATADGDTSTIFDGATVRLFNGEGHTPAPSVFKENADKTLEYNNPGSYHGIYYEMGGGLGTAYTIAGTLSMHQVRGVDAQVVLMFGTLAAESTADAKAAVIAARGDGGTEANINYTNGFRSSGTAWTGGTSPDARNWTLPAAGESADFVLRVEGRTVTMTFGGVDYPAYTIGDGISTADIAFGFYANNVRFTLSDLSFESDRAAGDIVYPTADGDDSRIFEDATVRLHNAEGHTPAPSVWKEKGDGTIAYDSLASYNAIFYEYASRLGDAYEIAGTLNMVEVGGLPAQFDIVFGTKNTGDVGSAGKMAVFAPRDEQGNEHNINFTNGLRSAGFPWTAGTNPDARDWTLPAAGESVGFVVRVEDRMVTVTFGGVAYASYAIAAGYDVDDIAWGFYASNVRLTLSGLYYGPVRSEGDIVYPTADGDESTIFEDATVRLHNADGLTPAPSVWKEKGDGTIAYDSLASYNAIFYEYASRLGDAYEIAGTLNMVEVGGLPAQFDIVFGTKNVGDIAASGKMAIFAPRDEQGNEFNINYTNGFRSNGFGWTTGTIPSARDWTLPEAGRSVDFVLRVQDRQVTVLYNRQTYAVYTLEAGVAVDDIAWGFYASNVRLTLSELYYGPIRRNEDIEYATQDGDASRLIDGATVRLVNGEGIEPAPSVWKERVDGALVHGSLASYNGILYEMPDALGDSYEIAGKLAVGEVGALAAQFAVLFGTPHTNGVTDAKAAVFAPRDENGQEANLNYTNGLRSRGPNWTEGAAPEERDWTLPGAGESLQFVVRVDNGVVTVFVDGKEYATYELADGTAGGDIAWGFYASNVKLTLSDLYVGPIRDDSDIVVYDTADGDRSRLFPDATIKLFQGEGLNPPPSVWKERSDSSLVHPTQGKYNGLLYDYGKEMGGTYEIAGTLLVKSIRSHDSEVTFIFAASDTTLLQGAMLSARNENNEVFNANYTNGFRGAGLSWSVDTHPEERAWSLPDEGESVDFRIQVKDRYVTVILNGTAYAPYRISDAINFGSTMWGFYSDGVNAVISDLYYGPLRAVETPDPEDDDDYYKVIRLEENTEGTDNQNGNQTEVPGTGVGSAAALALPAAAAAAGLLTAKRRRRNR